MTIQHENLANKGQFFIRVNSKIVAMMTYSKAGEDKIIIDHTEVDETLKGQNIGFKLVEKAVEYARNSSLKILPLCPFANSVFKKHPEFNDVKL